MKTGLHWAALAALSSLSAIPARAEWRCDCTTITDSCRAEVAIRGSWVEVSSDHEQCSRVDYFIDGLPFVAVVVGGEQRQDWIARTEGSQVLVQSCQVCRDNANGGATGQPRVAAPAAPAAEESGLTPIIKVVPQYPDAARAQGIEGRVELNFSVNPSGSGRVADGYGLLAARRIRSGGARGGQPLALPRSRRRRAGAQRLRGSRLHPRRRRSRHRARASRVRRRRTTQPMPARGRRLQLWRRRRRRAHQCLRRAVARLQLCRRHWSRRGSLGLREPRGSRAGAGRAGRCACGQAGRRRGFRAHRSLPDNARAQYPILVGGVRFGRYGLSRKRAALGALPGSTKRRRRPASAIQARDRALLLARLVRVHADVDPEHFLAITLPQPRDDLPRARAQARLASAAQCCCRAQAACAIGRSSRLRGRRAQCQSEAR